MAGAMCNVRTTKANNIKLYTIEPTIVNISTLLTTRQSKHGKLLNISSLLDFIRKGWQII